MSEAPEERVASESSFLPNRQLFRGSILVLVMSNALYFTGAHELDEESFDKFTATVYLLSFAAWFGASIWVSFFAGIIMFKNLPRHVFGTLQSKLFPRYFQFSACCLTACCFIRFTPLVTLSKEILVSGDLFVPEARDEALKHFVDALNNFGKDIVSETQMKVLIATLTLILTNLWCFEPWTTSVMFARHKLERALGTGHEVGMLRPADPKIAENPELVRLNRSFGMLHGISTTINLAALCLGVWHLTFIAQFTVESGSDHVDLGTVSHHESDLSMKLV